MDTNLIKIAFCYFTNESEKDFLNLSLKNLTKLMERNPYYEYKIFVVNDLKHEDKLKKEHIDTPCNLKHSTFNKVGIEGVVGIFNMFCEIYKDFNFDYIISLKEDCMLNYIGFIDALQQRLKKRGKEGQMSQISKQVNDISTEDWQCFSTLGVQSIMNILNGMMNPNDPHSTIMRKRVSMNPYTNVLTSLLLEMSHPTRFNLDNLEGVKTNINFFEMDKTDKKENYIALSFKSDKVDRKQSLETMRKVVEQDFDFESDFIKFVKGKRIAVVGNGDVDKDYSAEIDSADVVIRFNNFYNYENGMVGKKVDGLILTGTSACFDKLPGGMSDNKEIIQTYHPKLFLITEVQNQKIVNVHSRFKGCELGMLGNPSWLLPLTSGTIVLKMLADYDDVQVNVYGFSNGEEWNTYNETYNKGHRMTCHLDEDKIRIESLQKLCNDSINKC